MNTQKVKEWVEHHWHRLNSAGSKPPPLPISLPIMLVVLSMEFVLKLANAVMYYGTFRFITDKIEKKYIPNGTASERILFIVKIFCVLLIVLIVGHLFSKSLSQ